MIKSLRQEIKCNYLLYAYLSKHQHKNFQLYLFQMYF